jgi:hypothetical protein
MVLTINQYTNTSTSLELLLFYNESSPSTTSPSTISHLPRNPKTLPRNMILPSSKEPLLFYNGSGPSTTYPSTNSHLPKNPKTLPRNMILPSSKELLHF